jgi:hypothetical protein
VPLLRLRLGNFELQFTILWLWITRPVARAPRAEMALLRVSEAAAVADLAEMGPPSVAAGVLREQLPLHFRRLESESIEVIREVAAEFKKPVMLIR